MLLIPPQLLVNVSTTTLFIHLSGSSHETLSGKYPNFNIIKQYEKIIL